MRGRKKIVFATVIVLGMAVCFDFFGVRALPAELPAKEAAKYIIPKENLEIPEQMKTCAANLREIYAAIKKYEKEKGNLPDWLSDLVPDYLSSEKLFCPNDARRRSPFSPDPKGPCSYGWEFSSARIPSGWDPTRRTLFRDWKTQQVKLFGDVVPMVRCHHHGSDKVLNLSAGGEIWYGPLNWEYMFRPDYDSIHKQTLSRAIAPRRAEPGQPMTDEAIQERNKRMTELIAKLKDQRANDPVRGIATGNLDKTAPPFTLKDLNGKQVSLSDFKGKVVLLDFWATWCGPCRRVIPHLEALHNKYKDQGLVIIGMNNERDHDKVRAFAKEQMSYIILLDADEQFREYGVRSIPTAFYIDREGKIQYREVGYGEGAEIEVEQKVNELLTIKEGVAGQTSELDRLISQLKDKDHRIRRSAAEALAKLNWQPANDKQRAYYLVALQKWSEAAKLGPSAVEPLLVALNAEVRTSEDDAVRRSVRNALVKIGPLAVEPAINALKDEDTRLHRSAVRALGILRDKRAVEPLIDALKYNDDVVRRSAASELGSLGDERAFGPLLAALNDENTRMRGTVAGALGKLGDKRAIEPLIAALKDQDYYVRRSAASALGTLGDERALEPLIAAMKDENSIVRESAGYALGRLDDERAIEPLIAALRDENRVVRMMVSSALSRLANRGSAERLVVLLEDKEMRVRASAAGILAKIGDKRAFEPLIVALKDKDVETRRTAASALVNLGDKRAIEPLREAMRDDDDKVLPMVAIALAQLLDDERAVEPLLDVVRNPDSGLMGMAVLGMLTKIGPPAVEPLIAALKDEDKPVRYIATHVLVQLDDQRAVEPVITFLKSESDDLREPEAKKLEETDLSTVEYLIELLKHKEMFYVRSSSAWALGWLGDKRAVEPLVATLGKAGVVGNPYVARVQAAIALGRLGDKRAIEPLIDILKRNAITRNELKDEDSAGLTQMWSMQVQSWQRSVAKTMDALLKIGPPAVEPLIGVLKDENLFVRSFAAECLGELGDKGAVEALVEALKDEDEQVRQSATEALRKLGWQLGKDVE